MILLPRITELVPKKLIGMPLRMSLATDKTSYLWRQFMQVKNTIPHRVSTDLFSVQVYSSGFNPAQFSFDTIFEKWAAVEVSRTEVVPEGMETFLLSGGLYAVFIHKGAAQTGEQTFRYIFETWLPSSGYEWDERPQFEVLGSSYKNNHPDSEEEIWIPIKKGATS
ncbi:MAG: GyrI-like domain-containing protein [Bacteroidia bacterium]|nr:GyrI-like domain-containing protein [Bacteroidia bacterium]